MIRDWVTVKLYGLPISPERYEQAVRWRAKQDLLTATRSLVGTIVAWLRAQP